jgi:hypothetical protein
MASKGTSPYSTSLANSHIDFDLKPDQQMVKYKTEEEEAKAPHTLPFEFAALPEYFADMVDAGFNAAKTLDNVLRVEKYKDRKDLLKLKNNLEKMVSYLMKNVDPVLAKFTIGNDSKG